MPYNAVKPPPSVDGKDANEVMRVAVHDGSLHFALRRAFNDPGLWGLVFVDAARHVARAFAHEKMCTEDEAVERIRIAFEKAIREPPEGSAETTEIKDAQ